MAQRLARREANFLALLEGAVYGNPGSPYAALLGAAGIELGDVRAMVRERDLEGTLQRLREAGVHVTLDEFKCRRPLRRGSLTLELAGTEFDNPLLAPHYWARTSGSGGPRMRAPLDLGLLEHDAAHEALFRTGYELWARRFGIWRVKPPSTSGISNALRQAKLGGPVERWFDPHAASRDLETLRYGLFTAFTSGVARLSGTAIARPEHCPASQAGRVARWIADCRREGDAVLLDAQTGLGVRVALAAAEEGIDIEGTFFRLGGEPLSEAKLRAVAASGSRAASHYSMTEAGRVASACSDPAGSDDMHFLVDKLALVPGAETLELTTLLPFTPKVMINVDTGDDATLDRRACGCPLGELGFDLHVRDVRARAKLTAEGNHFLESDLSALVETVLPSRFGGGPTDYQLAQEEAGGLPVVSVVARPGLGAIPEDELLAVVLDFLRAEPRNRVMAEFWAQSETLRVARREPHVNRGGKTPVVHVEGAG